MTLTAGELAQSLGARLEGDAPAPVSGMASPESARAEDLIYVDSARHMGRAAESAARCVLAPPGTRLAGKTILEVKDPKLAFAKAAEWLLPRPVARAGVHATVIVAASARLAPDVSAGPYAVIEEDVEIGAGTVIEAFCFLGRGARVGANCRLHPRVTLYPGSRLGNRVEVHSGTVIGGDGFGYVFDEGHYLKFPQIGAMEVGDDVEIGCNTTIDRGSLGTTRIGAGVKIDNLVQIAHNVTIGDDSAIASQAGISGSCTLGEHVLVGGQAGMGNRCTIEDGAIIGGQAGILPGKLIRSRETVWGTPARRLTKFKEQYAWFARLAELAGRVRRLEEARAGMPRQERPSNSE